ncbi:MULTISPECIES: hypothetical protein [Paenibacillus]|uniref:hypothetical protein n=1 Tax=Paenibacillus TaxID=44249 RepID=UPI0022B92814|nr:hypothetical protein [Paenibacillus caseinilyticus]MCZ8518989.1 hypothetical protein [Paenibacillus caseinilyticus]
MIHYFVEGGITPLRTTRKPKYEIDHFFPELAPYRKKTIRLHPVRITGSMQTPPPVPRELLCEEHQEPLIPILQLANADYPEIDFPDGRSLLRIVWCPRDHGEIYEPYVKAYWGSSSEQNPWNSAISLNPETVIEYPHMEDLLAMNEPLAHSIMEWQEELGEEDEEDEAIYEYQLSVADGTKVGGYVNWIQFDETPTCHCSNAMEHLLTLSEAEFDGGTYSRWCPEELGDVWNLPYQERAVLQSPLGVSLGDMGKIYVFICHTCTSKPLQTVFQCS